MRSRLTSFVLCLILLHQSSASYLNYVVWEGANCSGTIIEFHSDRFDYADHPCPYPNINCQETGVNSCLPPMPYSRQEWCSEVPLPHLPGTFVGKDWLIDGRPLPLPPDFDIQKNCGRGIVHKRHFGPPCLEENNVPAECSSWWGPGASGPFAIYRTGVLPVLDMARAIALKAQYRLTPESTPQNLSVWTYNPSAEGPEFAAPTTTTPPASATPPDSPAPPTTTTPPPTSSPIDSPPVSVPVGGPTLPQTVSLCAPRSSTKRSIIDVLQIGLLGLGIAYVSPAAGVIYLTTAAVLRVPVVFDFFVGAVLAADEVPREDGSRRIQVVGDIKASTNDCPTSKREGETLVGATVAFEFRNGSLLVAFGSGGSLGAVMQIDFNLSRVNLTSDAWLVTGASLNVTFDSFNFTIVDKDVPPGAYGPPPLTPSQYPAEPEPPMQPASPPLNGPNQGPTVPTPGNPSTSNGSTLLNSSSAVCFLVLIVVTV